MILKSGRALKRTIKVGSHVGRNVASKAQAKENGNISFLLYLCLCSSLLTDRFVGGRINSWQKKVSVMCHCLCTPGTRGFSRV